MPAVGGGMGDRDVPPGQGVQGAERVGLVLFDREDEISAALVQVVRCGALAVQSIGGDDRAGQVQVV